MAYCPIHNREDLGSCQECFACYQKEVAEGHIPPAFIKAGVKFTFPIWSQIRMTEYSLALQHVNPKYGRTEKRRKELEEQLAAQIAEDKKIIAGIARGLADAEAREEAAKSVSPGEQPTINKAEQYRTY